MSVEYYQANTGKADNHSKIIGYLLWIFGFTGSHRFYYGRPITGAIWFCTFGLFLVGWLYDFCTMNSQLSLQNAEGKEPLFQL